MECIICFERTPVPYEIKCGSKVAHKICHSCEITLRLQTTPTRDGRNIKCPVCRKDEHSNGNRTSASYEAELRMLYLELYPRILPFDRPVVQFTQYTPAQIVPSRVPIVTPVPSRVPIVPVPSVTPAPIVPVPSPVPIVPVPSPVPIVPVPSVTPVPMVSPVPSVTPAPIVPVSIPPEPRNWCKNRTICCPTKNKTTRNCSYPMGCVNKVCRYCKMCTYHFEF